jgi:hypothetical protein
MRVTTRAADLRKRRLGRTGLMVSEIGFGAAHVTGSAEAEEALLRTFSLGIDFVETGRAYGESEYLIGRALSHLGDDGPAPCVWPARPSSAAGTASWPIWRRAWVTWAYLAWTSIS